MVGSKADGKVANEYNAPKVSEGNSLWCGANSESIHTVERLLRESSAYLRVVGTNNFLVPN